MKAIGLIVAASLAAGACAGPVSLAGGSMDRPSTAEALLARLPTPDSLWSSFEIRAQMAFSSRDGRGSLAALIEVRRGDSIRVRLSAPLGIEAGRILVTPDSVFFFDRFAGVLLVGDRASALLPAGLRGDDLSAAFFGFERPSPGAWTLSADSVIWQLERADRRESLLVDARVNRITAWDVRDADGTLLESRRFTDFERFDGLVLPRRIALSRPGDDSRAAFTVRTVQPTVRSGPLGLDLPPDLRRIQVY